MVNTKELFNLLTDALRAVSDAPEFEARQMLKEVCGLSHTDLLFGRGCTLSQSQEEKLRDWVARRKNREPLQYLLGNWEFYGRTFAVGEGVLIPRADTETLVETALTFLNGKRSPRVLDLCSGSGCIGLTIACERPDADITCVEYSEAAFAYLSRNRESLSAQATLLLADATDPGIVKGEFDLIVSNPPYLTKEDLSVLQPEVAYEPTLALDGGDDGLDFYRTLTALWAKRLKNGGMLGFEIGIGQHGPVRELLEAQGLCDIRQIPDLAGILRVVCGIYLC